MLIDSFLYYSEPTMCELRLRYLAPHVDTFVVVEADRSFTMQPHPAEFEKVYSKLPEHIQNKIVYDYIHIDEDDVPDTSLKAQGRFVEIKSRQRAHQLVLEKSNTGLIAFSDVDEIWDARYIKDAKRMIKHAGKMCWVQQYRVCFIDWVGKYGGWPGTKMTNVENLPEDIMHFYVSTNKSWGNYTEFLHQGWHLTIMGDQASKTKQISAKRETPGWESKVGKTSDEISETVWTQGWNTVVKKTKMKAYKHGVDALDPALVEIAKQFPDLWSGKINP